MHGESAGAWTRLCVSLVLMTIGSVGMYAMTVALPPVQAEFGATRSEASLPYTAVMIGFGIGSILMGRLADRFGVIVPMLLSAVALGLGFVAAGAAAGLGQLTMIFGTLIGLVGVSATFAPLIADTALWFTRRRGIAVAICASGNYLAGTVWPPILQQFFESYGWRATFTGVGIFCAATMLPLALALRRRAPVLAAAQPVSDSSLGRSRPLGFSPRQLQVLLWIAGVACCVAMAMPQAHIVAYCIDLGYAAARGAEMLSLVLGFGIVSRLVFGSLCDRIGVLQTLLVGSALQALALLLFLPWDSLVSLYLLSAFFGLVQGGIVPTYAIIVREHFDPREVGARTGLVMMATMLGMALGGWMSGVIFDMTGSYRAAFLHSAAWNLLNLAIVFLLLRRSSRRTTMAAASTAS